MQYNFDLLKYYNSIKKNYYLLFILSSYVKCKYFQLYFTCLSDQYGFQEGIFCCCNGHMYRTCYVQDLFFKIGDIPILLCDMSLHDLGDHSLHNFLSIVDLCKVCLLTIPPTPTSAILLHTFVM